MTEDYSKLNWLDLMACWVSPRWGFERYRARTAIATLSRAYDGASKGRRTKNWRATNASAQAEISPALSTLRNRSRDLVRNEPYAAKGISTIVSNTIGTGIMAKIKGPAGKLWSEWAETKACDHFGQMDFYSLQALIMRTIVESGEVLILKRRSSDKSNPLRIEVVEPDLIDTSIMADNIIDGIEFDDDGRIVAYHLFSKHPGDSHYGSFNKLRTRFKSERVPASDVIHPFRTDRPGQIRGVPWLAPAMIKLRDYSDYEDAQLMRQKIAACFVGFMVDTQDPLTQSSTTEERKPLSERFQPGAWEVLPPGKDIRFGTPPGVGSDYEPYVRRVLLAVSAALGISYEALTGDLSRVNFSSGRMGWIEFHRNIEFWRWSMFIPRVCIPVWEWFVEAQMIAGNLQTEPSSPIWTPPRREMIDPVKEGKAMNDAIRSGLATLSDSLRQLGVDPDEHLKELAEDNKKLDKFNLTLDSDPRRDVNSGNTRTTNEEKDDEKPEPEEDTEQDGESEESEQDESDDSDADAGADDPQIGD